MTMMFEVRRYSQQDSLLWNRFVEKARNATFLFHRDYMDYHADRFDDYSLMFFKQGKLYALLPAHLKETTLYSHFGLTYGGLIMGMDVTIVDTCQLFDALNDFLVKQGITKVVYRPVPWIYHLHPSEEDLYAIFWRCHATLSLRNIGTTIFLQQQPKWRKDHLRRLKKAKEAGVTVVADADIREFWNILEQNLQQRFQAKPVHSLQEMLLLKERFPKEIVQYNAYREGRIIGGLTLYLSKQVVHGQYSATNDEGKEYGAMEAIYDRLVNDDFSDMMYLDFGSSTEQQCSVINEGLIAHKEGYGGRGVCYDTYEWVL